MNKPTNIKSLFTIQSLEENNGNIQAKATIDKDNEIYKAHFPGDPITPGVCQMHLIKEVLSKAYPNKNFKFKFSKQIKFTEVLRPNENIEVSVSINTIINKDELIATAQIFNLNSIFLKAKLSYSIDV